MDTTEETSFGDFITVGHTSQPRWRCVPWKGLLVLVGIVSLVVLVAAVILTAGRGESTPSTANNETVYFADTTDVHVPLMMAEKNNVPSGANGTTALANATILDDPVIHILTQVEELESLGCHPTAVKVPVRDEVGEDIDDMSVYPRWVLTSRCVEECSFCRDDHQLCLPAPGATILKAFALAYQGPNNVTQFRELSVVQHTSCQCQQQ